MKPDGSTASQRVLGSVGLPLISAKPSELNPGRDVKTEKADEQGAPKRSLISLRGIFPHKRILTDIVLDEIEGWLCILLDVIIEKSD